MDSLSIKKYAFKHNIGLNSARKVLEKQEMYDKINISSMKAENCEFQEAFYELYDVVSWLLKRV